MHLFDSIPRGKQEHGAFFIVRIVAAVPGRL